MGNPRAVVTVTGFKLFIGFHLVEHLIVPLCVFARDKSRHAAHRKGAALVAGFDQQTRVGAQERFIHGHNLAIRQYAIGIVFQGFDVAENIVPASAVQADNMVAQGVQNFIHLEHGRQRFNQQGGLDGTARQVETIFRVAEHFAPPGRFLPGLRFWQIEIRAAAFCQQILVVMEEIKREIKQAARNGFPTPGDMFFRQVQAAYATDQHRRVRFELVNFAGFVGIADGAVHGVAQVDLPLDDLTPVRRQRVFKIGHEDFNVGVHGVDHHFALYRTGDLNATIL